MDSTAKRPLWADNFWKPLLVMMAVSTLCCLLHASPLHAAAAPLLLGKSPSQDLSGHLEELVDPGGNLTLSDILQSSNSARFIPIPGNLNKSYTGDVVWLRFTMLRSAEFPEDSWLLLTPPFLDYVTIYLQTGKETVKPSSYVEISLGDHVPVAERPVQHPEFVMPLLLPLEKPVTVYVRIKSTSVLNLAGAVHTPVNFIHHNYLNILNQGGYLGIAIVICLVNLVIFLRIRDPLFLYFSLYILAIFANQLGISGIITLVWPSMAHILSDYLTGAGMGASIAFFSIFAMRLFNTARQPWVHRFFVCISLTACLVILSVPLNFYALVAPPAVIGLLCMIVLLNWLSIRSVIAGEPGGVLYLSAFGISNLGYVVHFLRMLGLFPLAWWNTNPVQVASLINMVLMALAMTERLRAAETNAIKAAREAEHKAVQLANEMTMDLRKNEADLENALTREKQNLKNKTKFLAILSHEYRTPLAIIQANLDMIQLQQNESTRSVDTYLSNMKHAVARLVETMEVSLQRDRLDNISDNHTKKRIDLTQLLDEIIDKAEVFWPERLFVFEPEATHCSILGDAGQIKTAVFNLIDNSCKYSSANTLITVKCYVDGDMGVISIGDHGEGLSPFEVDTIFEKYRRGRSSNNTSGAGLGLWLVRQIVEQHGGSVTLAQNQPKGTVVTLLLPIIS